MRRNTSLAASIAMAAMAGALVAASVHAEDKGFRAVLLGTQEVPSVSTGAHGGFALRLSPDGAALHYAAWFGPLVVAVIAKVLLDRKYRVRQPVQGPSAPQLDYLF